MCVSRLRLWITGMSGHPRLWMASAVGLSRHGLRAVEGARGGVDDDA
jgi:hypothetical protein